mgnify:CR=1 FL=1
MFQWMIPRRRDMSYPLPVSCSKLSGDRESIILIRMTLVLRLVKMGRRVIVGLPLDGGPALHSPSSRCVFDLIT